jgi:hypothetical protein
MATLPSDLADRFYFHQPASMGIRVYNFFSQSRADSFSLLYCILFAGAFDYVDEE